MIEFFAKKTQIFLILYSYIGRFIYISIIESLFWSRMKSKSGQTTSEFLMTYGWVIITLLVLSGSLLSFGIIKIDFLMPSRCSISVGITCIDFNVESGRTLLVLKNTRGERLTIHEITVSSGNQACSGNLSATLETNSQSVFVISPCDNGAEGQAFNGRIRMSYSMEGKLTHSADGTLKTRVAAGSSAPSPSEALDAYISGIRAQINLANQMISDLQNPNSLQALADSMAVPISVQEYNNTLKALSVMESLTTAVNDIESLLQEILDAGAASGGNAAETPAVRSRLDLIRDIRNATVVSVAVTYFEPELSADLPNLITGSVIDELAAAAGLSEADKAVFRQESEALQDRTTVTGSAQALILTFLSGRTANATLFEKAVSISGSQEGEFYVNEFIDKNITGSNDLNASEDIANTAPAPPVIVADDPIIRWSFSDMPSATVKYTIGRNVPSENINSSRTVVTTAPRKGV